MVHSKHRRGIWEVVEVDIESLVCFGKLKWLNHQVVTDKKSTVCFVMTGNCKELYVGPLRRPSIPKV